MKEEKSQRDTVTLCRVQVRALLACSPRDIKSMLAMILEYGINGKPVDCPKHLVPTWTLFKDYLGKEKKGDM